VIDVIAVEMRTFRIDGKAVVTFSTRQTTDV
jgi:hypothetical protein